MIAPAFRSHLRDVVWPALPDDAGARMLALQFEYDRSETWPAAEIEARQFGQIEELLRFSYENIPFWRDRLRKAGLRPGQKLTAQTFGRLPVLTRQQAQAAGLALRPTRLPPDHGAMSEGTTSGSTGTPLRFARSAVAGQMFLAANLRLTLWHGFDMAGTLAISRQLAAGPTVPQSVQRAPSWGAGFEAFRTGPGILFEIRLPVDRQADILDQEQAAYLLTFPSNAAQIARHCRETGRRLPALRAIASFGEALSASDRALCEEVFAIPVIDAYSTEEAGFLAMQCPAHPHLHVVAQNARLEVLNAAGHACAPGQSGRVVVTPLHNFATPLLRYEIGDYAEVGATCDCGRSLPVLTRILGRARDRVRIPDGTNRLAFWGARELHRIPAIVQCQLAQVAPDILEFRLVTRASLAETDERMLAEIARDSLGYPFKVRFTYVEAIARAPSGKYQDFVSEIG